MLDHVFLSVSDIDRSVAFYEEVPPYLGIDVRNFTASLSQPPQTLTVFLLSAAGFK